jgi:hypothetical protein
MFKFLFFIQFLFRPHPVNEVKAIQQYTIGEKVLFLLRIGIWLKICEKLVAVLQWRR